MPPWAGRIFFSSSEDGNIHSCVNCFPDHILVMFCWLEKEKFCCLLAQNLSPFLSLPLLQISLSFLHYIITTPFSEEKTSPVFSPAVMSIGLTPQHLSLLGSRVLQTEGKERPRM